MKEGMVERPVSPWRFGLAGAVMGMTAALLAEWPLSAIQDRTHPVILFGRPLPGCTVSDLDRRLAEAGAKTGDVQISLEWNNHNDLDLYVCGPDEDGICLWHRRSGTGGELDVDRNVSGETDRPVENVYWPRREAPAGVYRFWVQYYQNHGDPDPTPFRIRARVNGKDRWFYGASSSKTRFQYVGAVSVGGMPIGKVDTKGPWIFNNAPKQAGGQ